MRNNRDMTWVYVYCWTIKGRYYLVSSDVLSLCLDPGFLCHNHLELWMMEHNILSSPHDTSIRSRLVSWISNLIETNFMSFYNPSTVITVISLLLYYVSYPRISIISILELRSLDQDVLLINLSQD